jgi:hypothetical protein
MERIERSWEKLSMRSTKELKVVIFAKKHTHTQTDSFLVTPA